MYLVAYVNYVCRFGLPVFRQSICSPWWDIYTFAVQACDWSVLIRFYNNFITSEMQWFSKNNEENRRDLRPQEI